MHRRTLRISLISIILIFSLWLFLNLSYSPPILLYHSIDSQKAKISSLAVSERIFAKQMDFLKRNNYKVISLKEIVNMRKNRFKKKVAITFDDGYKDNYKNAFGILKRYDFPFTIFLIVENIGKEDFLTKEEIREMSLKGAEFGSHTLTHSYLPELNRERLIKEISNSKRILEDLLDKNVDFISYPLGGFNKEIQEIVKEAGYLASFTTNRGYKNKDTYALRRIKVTDRDNLFKFWFKVSGYYHLFKRLKPPS